MWLIYIHPLPQPTHRMIKRGWTEQEAYQERDATMRRLWASKWSHILIVLTVYGHSQSTTRQLITFLLPVPGLLPTLPCSPPRSLKALLCLAYSRGLSLFALKSSTTCTVTFHLLHSTQNLPQHAPAKKKRNLLPMRRLLSHHHLT